MDISVDIVEKSSKHKLSYSVTSSLNMLKFDKRRKLSSIFQKTFYDLFTSKSI